MPLVTMGPRRRHRCRCWSPLPAPSRRIHVSTVNFDAPSCGAGAERHPAFGAADRSPCSPDSTATVMVTVSLPEAGCRTPRAPGRTVPWPRMAVVVAAAALANTTGPGPLTFVHWLVTAARETVVGDRAGKCDCVGRERDDWSAPALTAGAVIAAAVTVTVTCRWQRTRRRSPSASARRCRPRRTTRSWLPMLHCRT